MNKFKFKKTYIISLVQLIIQFACFIWGICFTSNSNVVSTNFLEILTKIQVTNSWQNFIWCFTNNLSVVFIVFWLSYWSFGVLGTLWCANSAFMLGAMIKFSIMTNSWISVCFILLELTASIIAMLSSTYFIFNRISKKNYLHGFEYETEKKKREKNILLSLLIIASIFLIAAILETVALNLIK